MSPTLRKLSLVLGLLAVASMAQAVEIGTIEVRPIEITQGCCWQRTGSTVVCSAPVLKKDCGSGYTWVADANCGSEACGG